jgi:aminopeptidase N
MSRIAGVKRIGDVMRLRAAQFAEDSSPMAHPVRPESYIKMDNFYTVRILTQLGDALELAG